MKFRWNHLGLKTRALQYFFFITTVISLFVVPWEWLASSLIFYGIYVTIGGNVGLHRYFGHKSFQTTNFWRFILTFFSHYIGVGSVMAWVGQHRYHHKYADTEHDVHSPHTNNIWQVLFGLWDVSIPRTMIKDVLRDESLKSWHEHYFKMHLFFILLWGTVDYFYGTYLLYTVYAIPNFFCLMSGYILAFMTHMHGYRSFPVNDHSTNSWIANILTLGEGWHNNHHHNPNDWNTKILPHEWDLPALMIRYIKI